MEQSYSSKSFETYRNAFAPMQRVQQEGLKALGRFARFQQTLASDLLEHNIAGVQAMVNSASPVDYFAKQGELNVRFVEKVATHTREFLQQAAVRSGPENASRSAAAAQEELTGMNEEQDEAAASFFEHGDSDSEPSDESIEEEPEEFSVPKSTAKHGKKRAEKSRRSHTHS